MKKTDYYGICKAKLKYLNYADRTIEVYMHYINRFLNEIDVAPTKLNSNHFQSYLDRFQFTSVSQQNQVINAIRFLYKFGLNRTYNKVSFDRPKKNRKLPAVISKAHMLKSIDSITNLKHKAIISIAYSVGLRVSEVINLKISDIDSDRIVINIKQSKGRKDRVLPLSRGVLNLIRRYYKAYKPKIYLFNGQNSLKYTSSSCNNLVKKYIGKQYHFHLLRHSCFTNLVDENVNLRVIQKIAGHSSSRTTEIYTHVSSNTIKNVPLAL